MLESSVRTLQALGLVSNFFSLFEKTENQVPPGRLNPVHAAHKLLLVMISKNTWKEFKGPSLSNI